MKLRYILLIQLLLVAPVMAAHTFTEGETTSFFGDFYASNCPSSNCVMYLNGKPIQASPDSEIRVPCGEKELNLTLEGERNIREKIAIEDEKKRAIAKVGSLKVWKKEPTSFYADYRYKCDEPILFEWDLNEDGNYEKQGSSWTWHSFDELGIHTIGLRVTDSDGTKTTSVVVVKVLEKRPELQADALLDEVTVKEGEEAVLDGNCFGSTSCEWFDNGKSFGWDPASFRSCEPGEHMIKLVASDNDREQKSFKKVVVENKKPSVIALANGKNEYTTKTGLQVSFSAIGKDGDCGKLEKYYWDFDGDGEIDWSSEKSGEVTHTYLERGTFVTEAIVTDDEGTNSSDKVIVHVENREPVAEFIVSQTNPRPGEPVIFDAGYSRDIDGSITEFSWDFDNDGTYEKTTKKPVVQYTYMEEGTFNPELFVKDNEAAVNTGRFTNISVTEEELNQTKYIMFRKLVEYNGTSLTVWRDYWYNTETEETNYGLRINKDDQKVWVQDEIAEGITNIVPWPLKKINGNAYWEAKENENFFGAKFHSDSYISIEKIKDKEAPELDYEKPNALITGKIVSGSNGTILAILVILAILGMFIYRRAPVRMNLQKVKEHEKSKLY